VSSHREGPSRRDQYQQSFTTRVLRVWQETGAKQVLLHRIDWEQPGAPTLDDSLLRDLLSKHVAGANAVVLKDMGKGIITEQLISQLSKAITACAEAREGPKPRWFISSKLWADLD
jgi:bifunctional ADP-heptose synthase (sugar kinase/adenylyltransferase)